MSRTRAVPVIVAFILAASWQMAAKGVPNDRQAVEHALNRLTFGPRPGDVERVQKVGLSDWIDQQLTPARVNDSALQSRLRPSPDKPAQFDSPQAARMFGRESVQYLASSKIVRAVYSERQLEEVLVDFWFNHFNVFAGKGRTSSFLDDYETRAIRPHVLGSFRELLGATAKSPAMLFYLDNWLSADPEAAERMSELRTRRQRARGLEPNPQAQQAQSRRRGLNENYGRELLELHTLGVDGGYTQKDIVEVARAFTGWTIAPQQGDGLGRRSAEREGGFRFMPALHDRGEKVVLGQTIKAGGGIDDGERVLDIVAAHPATARHIAFELAQRFVSDEPPKKLVDRAAERFRETKGNLREVVKTIVTSQEFFAAEARHAKVKTPLEFVASAYRATGRELPDARVAMRALQQLGMPLYMCQPPTGYDDTAETWATAGALVTRMNVAQQIAGRDLAATIGGPEFQRR